MALAGVFIIYFAMLNIAKIQPKFAQPKDSAQPLLQKLRTAQSRVQLITRETHALVQAVGALVARQHLQRDFASTALAGEFFNFGQQLLTHTLPTMAGQHGQVMHINQRAAGES